MAKSITPKTDKLSIFGTNVPIILNLFIKKLNK